MNKLIILLCMLVGISCSLKAEISDADIATLERKIETLRSETKEQLSTATLQMDEKLNAINSQLSQLEAKSDSIDGVLLQGVSSNTELANSNHAAATEKIEVVESNSQATIHQLTVIGIWAIVVLLITAIVIYIVLNRGIKKGSDAISSIKKAQDNLEEESVKLDTKLVELLDKQLDVQKLAQNASSPQSSNNTIDHTLALKVADEITRIEKNLLRMDQSVKGFKALSKAIDRIKDNFKANGYEIVTYLGQSYNEGMRINPEFVVDEELSPNSRIITAVSKPQVHYNGELIQKASVTVSQNI